MPLDVFDQLQAVRAYAKAHSEEDPACARLSKAIGFKVTSLMGAVSRSVTAATSGTDQKAADLLRETTRFQRLWNGKPSTISIGQGPTINPIIEAANEQATKGVENILADIRAAGGEIVEQALKAAEAAATTEEDEDRGQGNEDGDDNQQSLRMPA